MSYRGRTKVDVVSEFRRGEILDAAHAVFARKGFREATVLDIAAAAGVAKGTVYLYFKSKDDIYLAALQRGLDQLHTDTKAVLERTETVRETLRAFVETKVAFFEANREFFRVYFAEFGNTMPGAIPGHEAFERRFLEQVALIDAALQAGAKRGEVRRHAIAGAGFSIFAVVHSLVTRRVRGWSHGSLAQEVDAAVELLWKGLAH